jgi:hypothetical protein
MRDLISTLNQENTTIASLICSHEENTPPIIWMILIWEHFDIPDSTTNYYFEESHRELFMVLKETEQHYKTFKSLKHVFSVNIDTISLLIVMNDGIGFDNP